MVAKHLKQRLFAGQRTRVMGVLNVTPDSFSDGGQWHQAEDAITHALRMQKLGADLIDIGGESTRPGAQQLTPAAEQERILPVIEGYLQRCDDPLPLSIDTLHAETARAAVRAGADLINDVSGGLHDPAMYETVADLQVPYICQHMRGSSETMDQLTDYGGDVVAGVLAELEQRLEQILRAGIARELVIIDPGLGFAKTHEQSWELVRRMEELERLGYPVLIGQSRKRFLNLAVPPVLQDKPAKIRDGATCAVTTMCAERRIWGVRVHNVAESVAAVRAVEYCQEGKWG